PAAIAAAVRAEQPDVLVLSEYTPAAEAELLAAFGHDYPHRSLDAWPNTSGMAIYSRLPFAEGLQQHKGVWMQRTASRAVLRLPDGHQIVLYAVHLAAPISMGSVGWNRQQVAKLIDDVRQEQLPVIVTGDFNLRGTTGSAA